MLNNEIEQKKLKKNSSHLKLTRQIHDLGYDIRITL
jgi:hypothetical protein